MKKLTTGIFTAITLSLSACSTLEVKPETSPIQSQELTYKFSKDLPSGRRLEEGYFLRQLMKQIKEQSSIKEVRKISHGGSIDNLQGLEIGTSNNYKNIDLHYINGDYHLNTGTTNKTESIASYSLHTEDVGKYKILTITTPKKIQTIPGRNAVFLPIQPLRSSQDLISDIEEINKNITIEIPDSKTFNGEINTKYGDESVYANFERLLGKFDYRYRSNDENVKKYDIKKDKIFSLDTDKKEIPLKISVYPYRDGSKVTYQFTVPYVIKGDGTTTFSESKVKEYIAKIEKIAND